MNYNLNGYKTLIFSVLGMFCLSTFAVSENKEKNTQHLTVVIQIKNEIIKTEKERVIRLADSFLRQPIGGQILQILKVRTFEKMV